MQSLEHLVSSWKRTKSRLELLQDIESTRLGAIWERLMPVVREHQAVISALMHENGDAHRYANIFGHFGRTGWLSDLRVRGDILELDQSYSCRGSSGTETIRLPAAYLQDPEGELRKDIDKYRAQYLTRRERADREQYEALRARFEG